MAMADDLSTTVAPINLDDERIQKKCMEVRQRLVILSNYSEAMTKKQIFDTMFEIINGLMDVLMSMVEAPPPADSA